MGNDRRIGVRGWLLAFSAAVCSHTLSRVGDAGAALVRTRPSPRPGSLLLRSAACIAVVLLARIATADALLYVSNLASNGSWEILRYDSTTGAFAGRFATLAGDCQGLTAGPDGTIYAANFNNRRVDRYDGVSGAFMGTFASFGSPYSGVYGVAFGPDGNLYVGMSGGDVMKVNGTTGASLGRFVAAPSGVFDFGGLAFRGNSLFVTYGGTSGKMYRYDATTGGNAQLVYGGFSSNGPRTPSFDAAGNVYVPDWQTTKVYKFDGSTLALSGTIVNSPSISPVALGFGGTGNLLVLSENGGNSTIRGFLSNTGSSVGTLVQSGSGGLYRGFAMATVTPVPEVDPAACGSALALVAGALAMLERRRGRRA